MNGHTRMLPFYLVDGIYPRFAFLISPDPEPSTEEQTTFDRLQAANRKDVERLFGVLMKRFHVALHPGRYRSVLQLVTTYKAICILHNMCVESRRSTFLSRRRRDTGGDGGTNCCVGGDAGVVSDGGDGQSGGAHAVGGAAAGGPAPDRAAADGLGGVAAAIGKIDAAGSAPPALHPDPHLPAPGTAANFDAWAETQNPAECESLRDDLTADIFCDRGDLLARNHVVHNRGGMQRVFFSPLGRGSFFPTHSCVDHVFGSGGRLRLRRQWRRSGRCVGT